MIQKGANDSQIVRVKETLRLSHAGRSQRQASGKFDFINCLCCVFILLLVDEYFVLEVKHALTSSLKGSYSYNTIMNLEADWQNLCKGSRMSCSSYIKRLQDSPVGKYRAVCLQL